MSSDVLALVMFPLLLVGLFTGHHIGAVLGGLGLIFGIVGLGPQILPNFVMRANAFLSDWILVAIPLFVLMANFLERTGVAAGMFQAVRYVFGPLRGGVAAAVIAICTLLAACTGIVAAGVISAGLVSVGPMQKYGYDKSLTAGVIAAGGTLGILIPPSTMLVLMGSFSGVSVGLLFAGAIMPGLILSALYLAYILVRCYLRPQDGPALSIEERRAVSIPMRAKMAVKSVIPPVILIVGVLGTILFGVATPTEAAGVGAFLAFLMTLAYKTCTWKGIKESVINTATTTSMIVFIGIGGICFGTTFTRLGGGEIVVGWLLGVAEFSGTWGLIGVMLVTFFLLGCFIDWLPIMFITFPVFIPVATQVGIDLLYLVVLLSTLCQTCFLTPPFGYALFYLKGVLPLEITTSHVYRGVIPFILLQLIGVALCLSFPQIILWLPSVLVG